MSSREWGIGLLLLGGVTFCQFVGRNVMGMHQRAVVRVVARVARNKEPADQEIIRGAFKSCIDGMIVLTFMAQTEGERSAAILALENAYVAARLKAVGVEPTENVLSVMRKRADAIEPTADDVIAAYRTLLNDIVYFTIVYEYAVKISCKQRMANFNPCEGVIRVSSILDMLRAGARQKGWMTDFRADKRAAS